MFRITKTFAFSAAHHLLGLAPDHPCSRPHGHNYEVVIVLEGAELNAVGFVRDYRDLDEIKQWLDKSFDHQDLNERFGVATNPTAENIAQVIYKAWKAEYPELRSIGVSETPKTMAWYTA